MSLLRKCLFNLSILIHCFVALCDCVRDSNQTLRDSFVWMYGTAINGRRKEGRCEQGQWAQQAERQLNSLWNGWIDAWREEKKRVFFLRCANDLNINARKRSSSSILWGVSSTKSLFSCLRDFALLLPRNRQVERKTQLWISSFNSRAKYTESIITPIMNGGAEK